MATYADIYNAATDAEIFQPRCYVAAWLVASNILADAQETSARKSWASKVVEERLAITSRQLAFQVLRDATVQTNPGAATDDQILQALISRLDVLVTLG